jgi:hypothetical protein
VNQLAVYDVGINASIMVSFRLITTDSHPKGLLDEEGDISGRHDSAASLDANPKLTRTVEGEVE